MTERRRRLEEVEELEKRSMTRWHHQNHTTKNICTAGMRTFGIGKRENGVIDGRRRRCC